MVVLVNLKKVRLAETGTVKLQLIFEDDFLKIKYPVLIAENAKRADFTARKGQFLIVENLLGYRLNVFAGAGKKHDFKSADLKTILADAFRLITDRRFAEVNFEYSSSFAHDSKGAGRSIALAIHLSNYRFIKYKSKEDQNQNTTIKNLNIYYDQIALNEASALKKGLIIGEQIASGITLARDLINEPASHLHPDGMVRAASEIEKESNGRITVKVLSESECQRLGMGAFLAVAQGSERPAKFIILRYQKSNIPPSPRLRRASKNPNDESKIKNICLIGKSILFDSGGLSLKPSDAMVDMKIDMAGGAAVLGVFKILSQIDDLSHQVFGILPVCENMPSGKAMRPGDVVRALNGKTVEILNTDAEGRLTLADALSYSEKYLKPDLIIDLATLTGACMVALGKEITGLFGNQEKTLGLIEDCAKECAEELWRLPLYKRYLQKMTGGIAQLKNVAGRWGGAITGALFLAEFVKKTAWLHLDIAGTAYNTDDPHGITHKGGTGWGVETVFDLINRF